MSRRTLETLFSTAVAIAAGIGVSIWGLRIGALFLVLALILLVATTLESWVVPIAVFCVAAVPHGSFADPVLSVHFGQFSLLIGEIAIATACVASGVALLRTGKFAGPRLGVRLLLLWFFVIAGGLVVGLASGNSMSAVVQDLRPLLGYLGFWIAWQLTNSEDRTRVAWAIVLGCAVVSVLNIAVVSTGWQYAAFLTDSGRVWFRNGVLYPLALPLGLLLRGSVKHPLGRFAANACVGLTVAGCLLSGTRSYWAASGLSIALFLLVRLRSRRTLENAARLSVSAAIALAVLVVAFVGTSSGVADLNLGTVVGPRIQTLSSLSTDSSLGTRWMTFVTTNRQLSGSWVAGKGLGSRIALTGSNWTTYSTEGQYVDNVPQTVVLKFGLVGLVALALLWGFAVLAASRSKVKSGSLRTAFLCAVPGLLILIPLSSYLVVYQQLFVFAVAGGLLWDERTADRGVGVRNE